MLPLSVRLNVVDDFQEEPWAYQALLLKERLPKPLNNNNNNKSR
jgi:hypothetical protein